MKKTIVTVALLASSLSQAALIDNDLSIANTFIDTETNQVWLDPSATGDVNRTSYSDGYSLRAIRPIDENLALFSDFRIATKLEVETLVYNIFPDLAFHDSGMYIYNDSWSRSAGGERSRLDEYFSTPFNSVISVAGGYTTASSFSYSSRDSSRYELAGLYSHGDDDFGLLEIGRDTNSSYSYNSWFGGRYLSSERDSSYIRFRDFSDTFNPQLYSGPLLMVQNTSSAAADVSEPMTLSLLGLSLAGFGYARKKRNASRS